jgi:hypothetical protein
MMDGIFGIGDVGRIYVAPAGSVDFKPLGETKPMTLIASENGDDFSAWKETTATIEFKVKPKRTKRGKLMRDRTLERILAPKRYRLPRKMKKRLKRENNGNLPFVINCEVIGRDNDTLIVQANGLQYGTRKKSYDTVGERDNGDSQEGDEEVHL